MERRQITSGIGKGKRVYEIVEKLLSDHCDSVADESKVSDAASSASFPAEYDGISVIFRCTDVNCNNHVQIFVCCAIMFPEIKAGGERNGSGTAIGQDIRA